MLTQFTFKNFRSFRDESTLDMQASALHEHEGHLQQDGFGASILPLAVVYGPNGGGKSNVLKALAALQRKVVAPLLAVSGKQEGLGVRVQPFRFDKVTADSPSEFEIYFQTGEAEYRYILHVQEERIVYEALDRVLFETKRKSALFERDEQEVHMRGALRSWRVSEDLSETVPLLSYLALTHGNNAIIADVMSWFLKELFVINVEDANVENFLTEAVFTEEGMVTQYRALFLNMLQAMEMDIVDFRVEKSDEGNVRVFTVHEAAGVRYELNLREESAGTRKLFALLWFFIRLLRRGGVLVLDELDAKLHPQLLGYLIELVGEPTFKRSKAQLIFTSHDMTTMDRRFFRRDEIWFVAKGQNQNSKLYALAEFKARNDADYAKQYLEGRYGADPYLRRIVDWGQDNG